MTWGLWVSGGEGPTLVSMETWCLMLVESDIGSRRHRRNMMMMTDLVLIVLCAFPGTRMSSTDLTSSGKHSSTTKAGFNNACSPSSTTRTNPLDRRRQVTYVYHLVACNEMKWISFKDVIPSGTLIGFLLSPTYWCHLYSILHYCT